MNRFILSSCAVALVASSGADGIVIRHDRADADYLALGAGHDMVGRAVPDGVCTLIAPDWVITAGHVAQNMSPFARSVEFGGRRYTVQRVVFHPKWKGRAGMESFDMALLQLASPVEGVTPAALYGHDDEVGRTVMFVGNGDYGNGRDGPLGGDRQWRGAQNVVEEARPGWLRFVFNPPDTALEMEGISGPGDSGGPALIEVDGLWHIAGVSSSNFGGDGECRYNSNEMYARVSTERAWIEGVFADPPPDQLADGAPVDVSGGDWPDHAGSKIAQAFFEHLAAGTMLEFEQTHRSARALSQRSAEDRAAFWMTSKETWGELTVVEAASQGADGLWVRAVGAGGSPTVTLKFIVEAETGKLSGVVVGGE